MAKTLLFKKKAGASLPEQSEKKAYGGHGSWKILIVDDDPEVHSVTRLILGEVTFKGRSLTFLSAYSAAEAKPLLRQNKDIAMILLDVVMETDDAGLRLVHFIRQALRNESVRIVLRTGQPGQAPEDKVIINYDINDYKAKTELTAQKLLTTTIAAIRAYEHILALEVGRRGLHQILESSDSLFQRQSMASFSAGVLIQLSAFLGSPQDGVLCVRQGDPEAVDPDGLYVLAAIGQYACYSQEPLSKMPEENGLPALIRQALHQRRNLFTGDHAVLYFAVPEHSETVAVVSTRADLSEFDRRLLEVFASKISVGFENVSLVESLEARVQQRTLELKKANERLERLAMIDSLTDLFNRRAFVDRTNAVLAQGSAAVLLLDIDHFKIINDRYGHDAGDRALVAMARALESCVADFKLSVDGEPEKDGRRAVAGRLGGEEFGVLLPGATSKQACSMADAVRSAMAALTVSAEGAEIAFTVSIGCAAGPVGSVFRSLYRNADAALYVAKENGRNQVRLHDNLKVEPEHGPVTETGPARTAPV